MHVRIARSLIALLGITLAAPPIMAQPAANNPAAISTRKRFSGQVLAGLTRRRPIPLDYQVWSVVPGAKLSALPLRAKGYLVLELRGGKLATVINGTRQERHEGEFWVVAPDETMELQTGDDSVVIQSILLPSP
jgi:hypothetical protein